MGIFKNFFGKSIECRGVGCLALIDVEFLNKKGVPEFQILRCPACNTLNLTGHDIPEDKMTFLVDKVRRLEAMDNAHYESKGCYYSDEDLNDAWQYIIEFH